MSRALRSGRASAGAAAGLLILVAGACGGRTAPPPEPGLVRGVAPDLRGRRVLVLPFQQVLGVPGDVDAEFTFALRERGEGVMWILPADVDAVLARTPGMQARTRGLPVGDFLVAEVNRVGDPLYGELRRVAALVDAEVILLPVQAALASEPGLDPRVRTWATLLDVRTGRVLWFSFLEGQPAPGAGPAALTSAVEQVVGSLLWYAAAR